MSEAVIRLGFWKTSIGIFVKRLVFSVVAQAGTVLYTQLMSNEINWQLVRYAAATQAVYIIITGVRDYSDKSIPNTPSEPVKVEALKGN